VNRDKRKKRKAHQIDGVIQSTGARGRVNLAHNAHSCSQEIDHLNRVGDVGPAGGSVCFPFSFPTSPNSRVLL
jgi:hypothetical protein